MQKRKKEDVPILTHPHVVFLQPFYRLNRKNKLKMKKRYRIIL
jgi:hypothetical protein